MAAARFSGAILRRRNPNLSTAAAVAATTPSSRPPKPFSELKSSIRAESDGDRIAALLKSSARLPGFHAHRPLFALAVNKLLRLRRPDLIDTLLSSAAAHPKSPKTDGFFARLISLYSDANMPDSALALFRKIPELSDSPRSDKSLSALLSCYLNSKNYEAVVKTFNSAEKDFGFSPGIASHNVLLQALCASGDFDGAQKVFDEMAERGLKPDIVSYNVLLNGFARSGDSEGFDRVLKEILESGLELNVASYNCRILNFCKMGQSFKGEELLDVMVVKGVVPNLATFRTLVDGFCREGNVDGAVKVFNRLKVMGRRKEIVGVSPSTEMYFMVIRGLVGKERFDSALGFLKECLAMKAAPPFELVKQLIDGLVKNSKNKEAKEVVEKVRSIVTGGAIDAWKKVEAELAISL